MKTITTYLVLILLFFCNCSSNSSKEKDENEIAIQKVFEDYKKSILENDGALHFSLIDGFTKEYYQNILNIIKHFDKAELQSHLASTAYPFIDQMIIFSHRAFTPHELINNSNLKEFVGGMIKHKNVDLELMKKVSFRNVDYVVDQGAVASFRVQLEEKLFMRCRVDFVKISGEWKMDVTSRFYNLNKIYKKIVQESGLDAEEFIFQSLEELNGISIDRSKVWEPTMQQTSI